MPSVKYYNKIIAFMCIFANGATSRHAPQRGFEKWALIP